ncbi:hypothetical protein [Psychrobacillus sp.]|uniref:hypothetical protein n=1 Tax=Psychrobacillus sp. TaxID=1871623 RepID=UPI0028BF4EFD|nr:hypothetical protein [Psychrobacillus sp.]
MEINEHRHVISLHFPKIPLISATADAFHEHGFNILVAKKKTYAPAVTRRKEAGHTKFGQPLSCGAFSSRYSRRSRRHRSNQLVYVYEYFSN